MKKWVVFFLNIFCILCMSAQSVRTQSVEWFQNSKLGLFIHWGVYSKAAGEWKGHRTRSEHFMLYERIPLKEYALIAKDFNPINFDAQRWVRLAKYAGMKYIVITAKHHDGFAMYNSLCSDYNIVKCSPFARDPMTELVKACKDEGLKFGFYYSLGRDWENPNVPTKWPYKGGRSNTWDYPNEDDKDLSIYIKDKVKPQLKELLTNYGKIDFIWFDTPEMVTKEQSSELRKLILDLQPHCLINQRIGNGMGDYEIIEQKLSNKIRLTPWESCLTMGKNWGYNKYDTIYKSPDVLLRHFIDIVSKGGNLLLNIGPDSKGEFPKQSRRVFDAFHSWLNKNGEAIYETTPWRVYGEDLSTIKDEKIDENFHDEVYDGTPREIKPDIRYTAKKNIVYIIARHVLDKNYILHAFSKKDNIRSIECLGENIKVRWRLKDAGLYISFDESCSLPPLYVLKVVL
ncbi:alpha-L-fucosidase [Phocaeicola plebeius]|uniref:alpha-L-fucosidase n=1 Tax=Phocaeicola plebeius TaxID=310297 RepID=UPI003078D325